MGAALSRKYRIFLVAFMLNSLPVSGWAQDSSLDMHREQNLISNIMGRFFEDGKDYMRVLPFVTFQEPVSDQAATNSIPPVLDNRFEIDFRIDLKVKPGMFDFMAKPRLEVYTEEASSPFEEDRENEVDVYFHEWSAGIRPIESVAASYGREDLQWGPSYLASASNPFTSNNGRNSPKTEVRGADYAKVMWDPKHTWHNAFIVNTDRGRKRDRFDLFETVYALKSDLVWQDIQASFIGSYRDSEVRVGYYWTYNLSDAVILYNEAGFESGDEEFLGGASYTFEAGPVVYLEYFYNGSGTTREGLPPGTGQQQSGQFREALTRKNYVLIQVNDPELFDRLDLTLRYIANLDDSSQLIGLFADFTLGPYGKLFFNGLLFEGDEFDEFGQLLEYDYRVGLDYSF